MQSVETNPVYLKKSLWTFFPRTVKIAEPLNSNSIALFFFQKTTVTYNRCLNSMNILLTYW